MTRRGAVGIHELWNSPITEISGFKVTFADGFIFIHEGGLAILSRELIHEHGNVKKAKAIVQAKEAGT